MPDSVTRLYPCTAPAQALQGLALKHRLIDQGSPDQPFLYASFIMSANGAIAIREADLWTRPKTLSDPRDLQYLCELMIQADCLITSGSYLRDLQDGRLGDMLRLPALKQPYLLEYRRRHHTDLHPKVLVLSRSLDFTLPEFAADRIRVLAPADAPAERVRALQQQGVDLVLGDTPQSISQPFLLQQLLELQARTAYFLCGPGLSTPWVQSKRINRMYLSWLHQWHGGHPALNPGSLLPVETPVDLAIKELYQLDAEEGRPALWLGHFDL